MEQRISLITLGVRDVQRPLARRGRAGAGGGPLRRCGDPAHRRKDVRGGYSGDFLDPDGHGWEVAHNPHWTITDDGQTRLGS